MSGVFGNSLLSSVVRFRLWLCVFVLTLGGCGASEPPAPPVDADGIFITSVWPTRKAVFEAAPNTKLVEHEVTHNGVTYIIMAPENATFREGQSGEGDAEMKLVLAPGVEARFITGHRDLAFAKNVIQKGFGKVKSWAYADDDLLIAEFNRDDDNRYSGSMNVTAGSHEFFVRLDPPPANRDYGKQHTLENCLLLLKCADSLRLKEAS